MNIVSWFLSLFGASSAPQQPTLLAQQLVDLRVLRRTADAATDKGAAETLKQVDDLIAAADSPGSDWQDNWRKAWEAERLMARLLDEHTVTMQVTKNLAEAKAKARPGAAELEKRLEEALDKGDGLRLASLRALHETLLADRGWGGSRAWLDRSRRKRAGQWIIFYAIALTIAVVLPYLQFWSSQPLGTWLFGDTAAPYSLHRYGLYVAMSFGMLGALFSRLISFQTNFRDITYERAVNEFLGSLLLIRILFGMIGAILLYYAIFGGLIGGDLFPTIAEMASDPTKMPETNTAKLIVWSFIGGFSERLVPDFIQRSEATAAKADMPNKK